MKDTDTLDKAQNNAGPETPTGFTDAELGLLIERTLDAFDEHHVVPDEIERAVTVECDEESEDEFSDNVHLEHFDLLTGHLTGRAGSPRIRSHRADEPQAITRGLRRAGARWLRSPSVGRAREESADEYAIGWACAVVSLAPNDHALGRRVPLPQEEEEVEAQPIADTNVGDEALPKYPTVTVIPRRDAFWDLAARDWREGAFTGWASHMDFETLKVLSEETDGWDEEAVDGMRNMREESANERREDANDDAREIVVIYECWFRGLRLPEADELERKRGVKYHGTLVTLGKSSGGWTRLRKDRPYYGDHEGPLVIMGARRTGKKPVPTSPLASAHPQAKRVNAAAAALNRGMDCYRRQLLYRKDRAADAETVLEGGTHWAMAVDEIYDANGKALFEVVEYGGVTQQMLDAYTIAHERYLSVSGVSEIMRGGGTSNETATADMIAAQGSRQRTMRIARGYDRGWSEVLRRALRYLYESDTVQTSFGPEEAQEIAVEMGLDQPGTLPLAKALELGMTEDEYAEKKPPAWVPGEPLLFTGGRSSIARYDGTFDDLEIELAANSMRAADEPGAAERLTAFMEVILRLVPVAQQAPNAMPWSTIVREYGERYGVEDVAAEIDLTNFAGLPVLQLEFGATSGGARAAAPAGKPGAGATAKQVQRGGASMAPRNAQTTQPSPRPQEARGA